jgi:hypothetical protein
MFKVSSASLQIFIDTPNCVLEDRIRYSTVHIPNVFCDGHLQMISCVGIIAVPYCNHQMHRDFSITLYIGLYVWSRFTRHRKLSVFPLQRQIGQ